MSWSERRHQSRLRHPPAVCAMIQEAPGGHRDPQGCCPLSMLGHLHFPFPLSPPWPSSCSRGVSDHSQLTANLPLLLLQATGEKRPSTDLGKKPKSQKKKKKKDPNEPQKPVSAYALFFRDTQAAIKGQNPNATFGDVSKIVASMWDSLGEEQKQVSHWVIYFLSFSCWNVYFHGAGHLPRRVQGTARGLHRMKCRSRVCFQEQC